MKHDYIAVNTWTLLQPRYSEPRRYSWSFDERQRVVAFCYAKNDVSCRLYLVPETGGTYPANEVKTVARDCRRVSIATLSYKWIGMAPVGMVRTRPKCFKSFLNHMTHCSYTISPIV